MKVPAVAGNVRTRRAGGGFLANLTPLVERKKDTVPFATTGTVAVTVKQGAEGDP